MTRRSLSTPSAIAEGQLGPAAFLDRHHGHPKPVTTVTPGEFAIGATNAGSLARFFRGYQALALGREDAIFSGQPQARPPFEMGENALWIAGIALRHGLPWVTRDRTFARIPGRRRLAY